MRWSDCRMPDPHPCLRPASPPPPPPPPPELLPALDRLFERGDFRVGAPTGAAGSIAEPRNPPAELAGGWPGRSLTWAHGRSTLGVPDRAASRSRCWRVVDRHLRHSSAVAGLCGRTGAGGRWLDPGLQFGTRTPGLTPHEPPSSIYLALAQASARRREAHEQQLLDVDGTVFMQLRAVPADDVRADQLPVEART